MIQIKNFTDNDDIRIVDTKGAFQVIEYKRDLSVLPQTAATAFFCAEMNVRKRQLVCDLTKASVTCQAGAMQWMAGNVHATTGVKGVGDLLGKAFRGKVTGESAIKPEYTGEGTLVLEPTYKHILLLDTNEWNGAVVLDEVLFNLCLRGNCIVAIESACPKEELIEVDLQNDVLKVDGNFAIAWSNTLDFTVERSGKTLIGSAASGEGLVNVYRGTGKVLLAPIDKTPLFQ